MLILRPWISKFQNIVSLISSTNSSYLDIFWKETSSYFVCVALRAFFFWNSRFPTLFVLRCGRPRVWKILFFIYIIFFTLQNCLIYSVLSLGSMLERLVLKNGVECTSQRLKRMSGPSYDYFFVVWFVWGGRIPCPAPSGPSSLRPPHKFNVHFSDRDRDSMYQQNRSSHIGVIRTAYTIYSEFMCRGGGGGRSSQVEARGSGGAAHQFPTTICIYGAV